MMRRINVFAAADHTKAIGYLMIDDKISDADLVETVISWGYHARSKQVHEAVLIPKPKAIPRSTPEPESDGQWSRVGDTDYG
jgi:hypothetical protein